MGARVGKVAELLGTPLMPWQQLVADVGLELLPDGRPAFREAIVTVARQSGKSALFLAWMVDRALNFGRPTRTVYTAQDGGAAAAKLVNDFVPTIQRSPLGAMIDRVHVSNGREAVRWKNGSRIDVLSASKDAGHGMTIDLAVLDEVFADQDERREQAILPAMLTRPDAQMLLCSTAGDSRSAYFARKLEVGRGYVDEDAREGVAFFEWSAESSADPDDESVWWAVMPGLSGGTQTIEAVRHARGTMDEGPFRRAYLNVWVDGDRAPIPHEFWEAVQDPAAAPAEGVRFGVEVARDRGSAAVVAADRDGCVEVVAHRGGVGWVCDVVCELVGSHGGRVVVDSGGPASAHGVEIASRGVPVDALAGRDVFRACAAFLDSVVDQRVRVLPHPGLSAAVECAVKRPVGETWVWSRATAEDASPLLAASLALWAARPDAEVAPPMFFG